MPVMTIPAGETRPFANTKRFLNVLDLSGPTLIKSPYDEWEQTIKQGWTLDLQGVNQFVIENPSNTALTVEIESSPFPIQGGAAEGVEITNTPTIKRIEEAIQVNAQATVENGKMTIRSGAGVVAHGDIEVQPLQRVKVLSADAVSLGRSVTIANVSASLTKLRLGADNTVSEQKGLPLYGSSDAPASFEVDTLGELYVYNATNDVAHVSVLEVTR
tara:strand:+ start:12800 stop:13447 length:648 start_codon:yes stop_codon:yes gene_type:complete